jgi:hypothetical protein
MVGSLEPGVGEAWRGPNGRKETVWRPEYRRLRLSGLLDK